MKKLIDVLFSDRVADGVLYVFLGAMIVFALLVCVVIAIDVFARNYYGL